MPTQRRITIKLVSQFGAEDLPEYVPGSALPYALPAGSPGSTTGPPRSGTSIDEPRLLYDQTTHIVSVYVPAYPQSRFWVRYAIEEEPESSNTCYFFKLFVNQEHVVSWGVGAKEKFTGKIMFVLSKPLEGDTQGIERKTFQLGDRTQEGVVASNSTTLQILVYRAKGRKRAQGDAPSMQRMLADASELTNDEESSPQNAGINYPGGGMLGPKNPVKFYHYALIDPLDDPYMTFKFYFRSWDQLLALGVRSLDEMLQETLPPSTVRRGKWRADMPEITALRPPRPATPATPTPMRRSRSPRQRSKTSPSTKRNPNLNTAHPLGTPVAMPESTPGLTVTAPPSSRDYTGTRASSPIVWFRLSESPERS